MTTPRAALAALLATFQRCHSSGCERTAVYGGQYGWMTCEQHSGTDRVRTFASTAIEAAERALAAADVEVAIEPWDPNSGMSRICVNGIDHIAVDADTVFVVTKVAEALGARVVRR